MRMSYKGTLSAALIAAVVLCAGCAEKTAKIDPAQMARIEAAANKAESAANKAESAARSAADAAQRAEMAAQKAEAIFTKGLHKK
jgi:uncharacterized protein GlcG (DUF336 family)